MEKDNHPFEYVLVHWTDELMEPLSTWLKEITHDASFVPEWSELKIPDTLME